MKRGREAPSQATRSYFDVWANFKAGTALSQGLPEVPSNLDYSFYVSKFVHWRRELDDGKACSGMQEMQNNVQKRG